MLARVSLDRGRATGQSEGVADQERTQAQTALGMVAGGALGVLVDFFGSTYLWSAALAPLGSIAARIPTFVLVTLGVLAGGRIAERLSPTRLPIVGAVAGALVVATFMLFSLGTAAR